MSTGDFDQSVMETVLLVQIKRSSAYHDCANDYKGHGPILRKREG